MTEISTDAIEYMIKDYQENYTNETVKKLVEERNSEFDELYNSKDDIHGRCDTFEQMLTLEIKNNKLLLDNLNSKVKSKKKGSAELDTSLPMKNVNHEGEDLNEVNKLDKKEMLKNTISDLELRLTLVNDVKEFLTFKEKERDFYLLYTKHEIYSKRLNEFKRTIDFVKGIEKHQTEDNTKLTELKQELLAEINTLNQISTSYFREYLNAYKYYITKSKNDDNNKNIKLFYELLANKCLEFASDDINHSILQKPLSLITSEYILATIKDFDNIITTTSLSDIIKDEKSEILFPSPNLNYIEYNQLLYETKSTVIYNMDEYYKKCNVLSQQYMNICELKIIMLCKSLSNLKLKQEKKEDLLYREFGIYKEENNKLLNNLNNEENDIVKDIENLLIECKDNIDSKYLSVIKNQIDNFDNDQYIFGINKYFKEREYNTLLVFLHEIETEVLTIDLETLFMPIQQYKLQIIMEGYRLQWFSYFRYIVNTEESLSSYNIIIQNEINQSVERLETLKAGLTSVIPITDTYKLKINEIKTKMNQLNDNFQTLSEDEEYILLIEKLKKINTNIEFHYNNIFLDNIHLISSLIKSLDVFINIWENNTENFTLQSSLPKLQPDQINLQFNNNNNQMKVAPEIKTDENDIRSTEAVDNNNGKNNTTSELYKIFQRFILWKFEVLNLYYSAFFNSFFEDMLSIVDTIFEEEDYLKLFQDYSFRFSYYFKKLKYEVFGNNNLIFYKSILNNIKTCKSIFKQSTSDPVILKICISLSEFCIKCQAECDNIIRDSICYANELEKKKIKDMSILEKNSSDGKKYLNLYKNINNLIGKNSKFLCFSNNSSLNYTNLYKNWGKHSNMTENLIKSH